MADGGDGDDVLKGGRTAGTVDMGAGDDRVQVYGDGNLRTGTGRDTVTAGNNTVDTGSDDDVTTASGDALVNAEDGDDTITINSRANRDVSGGGGDDEITSTRSMSQYFRPTSARSMAETGDTVTIKNQNYGTVNGGDNNDRLRVEGWNYGTLNGEGGDDKVMVMGDNKGTINCGDGEDMSLDEGEGCEQVVEEIP